MQSVYTTVSNAVSVVQTTVCDKQIMCDIESNPKWALQHIDEILDLMEVHADEDAYRRMLSHNM